MSIAHKSSLANAGSKTAASSYSTNTTAAIASGDEIFVAIASDNTQTTDGTSNTHTGVSIGSLVFTKVYELTKGSGAAGAGITTSLWRARATAGISSGTAIVATFSTSITAKGLSCRSYTADNELEVVGTIQTSVSTASGPVALTISGLDDEEHLFLRVCGIERAFGSWAVGSGYTVWSGGSAAATSGGTSNTNVSLTVDYDIETGTSSTSDPQDNGGNGEDRANFLVAFRESSGSTSEDRAASDTLGLSDAAAGTLTFARSTAEGVGLDDAATRAPEFARTASDTLAFAENLTRDALEFARAVTDALTFTDAATVTALQTSGTATDSLTFADSATGDLGGDLSRTAGDTLALVDVGTRTAAVARAASDALTLSDSAATGDEPVEEFVGSRLPLVGYGT